MKLAEAGIGTGNSNNNEEQKTRDKIPITETWFNGARLTGRSLVAVRSKLQSLCYFTALMLIMPALSARAAVYYVSTKGNDSTGNGSSSKPWRTINKAAGKVSPGDTVNVLAGIYREHVTLWRDGTASSRITFQGQRGSKGEWLTIIDPSEELSSGWEAAPEIGTGVYKHRGTGSEIGAVIVDGYNVEGIWRSRLPGELSFLAKPSTYKMSSSLFKGAAYPFWDGVEATWAWYKGVLYFRFRNGASPNGKNIRVTSLNGGTYFLSPVAAAVRLRTARYNSIRDFHVRGARFGIAGQSYGSLGTSHTIIESNMIQHGYVQVLLNPDTGGACANNVIRHNVISPHRYGMRDAGGWRFTKPSTWPRFRAYSWNKYQYGNTTTGSGILLNQAGKGNVIHGNTITSCVSAVTLTSSTSTSSGTIISGNTLSKACSTLIAIGKGWTDTHIFDNVMTEAKYLHRWDSINQWSSSAITYVYGNWSWISPELGSFVYCHSSGSTRNTPTVWVYNNTSLGGSDALNVSSYVQNVGGLPKVRFVNNVFESLVPYDTTDRFRYYARMLGAFDYNRVRGTEAQVAAAWYGPHNVRVATSLWTTLSSALSGATSLKGGLDLSRTFKLRDVTYSALPGF